MIKVDLLDMTQGSLSGPAPFKASFKVRSPKHQEIVSSQWMSAEKDADKIMEMMNPACRNQFNGLL